MPKPLSFEAKSPHNWMKCKTCGHRSKRAALMGIAGKKLHCLKYKINVAEGSVCDSHLGLNYSQSAKIGFVKR